MLLIAVCLILCSDLVLSLLHRHVCIIYVCIFISVYSGDNRPGLVFSSKDAKAIQLEKRMRELNSKSKIKSKKVIEEENRCQGLLTTIPCHNKGFSLMQKMGYKPGMVLGKHGMCCMAVSW